MRRERGRERKPVSLDKRGLHPPKKYSSLYLKTSGDPIWTDSFCTRETEICTLSPKMGRELRELRYLLTAPQPDPCHTFIPDYNAAS